MFDGEPLATTDIAVASVNVTLLVLTPRLARMTANVLPDDDWPSAETDQ